MRIGIDLDNTLADYSRPFARLCTEFGLDPRGESPKQALRRLLRSTGREADWTRLQGEIYGARMTEATLAEGAKEFLARATHHGAQCFIVSHRTRRPIAGGDHDLHACAGNWLVQAGLGQVPTFFEENPALKLNRIRTLGVSAFIDDLPELLLDPRFPAGVQRVLFLADGIRAEHASQLEGGSWPEIIHLLFK